MKKILTVLFLLMLNWSFGFAGGVENIVPKPQQAYTRETISAIFSLNDNAVIYLSSDNPRYETAYFLNKTLRDLDIDTLEISMWGPTDTLLNGIVLTMPGPFISDLFSLVPDQKIDVTAQYPGAEGYVLDVLPSQVIIAGSDEEGIINGIRTFVQLFNPFSGNNYIQACRVVDAPDYPIRWAYYTTNVLVDNSTPKAKSIWKTASDYKLNGIQLNDFKFNLLEEMPQRYFDSLQSLRQFADNNYLEIIPGIFPFGYSDGILYHDVNLAAGLPVKNQKFVVEDGVAKPVPAFDVNPPNGGFENYDGSNIPGFLFIDQPGQISNIDTDVKHSGKASLKMDNFSQYDPANGNGRICYRTPVKRFTQYHASAYVKTSDFAPISSIQLNVINTKGVSLSFANADLQTADNGWQRFDITFNSLESDSVNVYWAVRGAKSGTIWWDDLSLEETSFVNLVRRKGVELTVDNPLIDAPITEGIDFDTLSDPKLGALYSYPGGYDTWHTPPQLKIKQSGLLNDGDTLYVSYFHTQTVYDGQIMTTLSDNKVYDIIEKEFRQIDSVLKPSTYFMNHDEIRLMNWENGDAEYWGINKKEITPAELLAFNVNKCNEIIHKYNPTANVWDWSDMFDIYHNAKVSDYFLVNGDLSGSAEMIPNNIGIVNWNNNETNSPKSLDYFSNLGFRQICAPYYDAGPAQIRKWKERAKSTKNFDGMMYTTWQSDYSALEPFAEYAWGHAPYIYHCPPDYLPNNNEVNLRYKITGDKWDNTWLLSDVKLYYRTSPADDFKKINLDPIDGNNEVYTLEVPIGTKWLQYYFTATDNHSSFKRIPFGGTVYFELEEEPVSVHDRTAEGTIKIYPNPVKGNKLHIQTSDSGFLTSEFIIVDLLGNTVIQGNLTPFGNIDLDISALSQGVYSLVILNCSTQNTYTFGVVR